MATLAEDLLGDERRSRHPHSYSLNGSSAKFRRSQGSHITAVWSSGSGPWGKTAARSASSRCCKPLWSVFTWQSSYPHKAGVIAGRKNCHLAWHPARAGGLLCPWSLTSLAWARKTFKNNKSWAKNYHSVGTHYRFGSSLSNYFHLYFSYLSRSVMVKGQNILYQYIYCCSKDFIQGSSDLWKNLFP